MGNQSSTQTWPPSFIKVKAEGVAVVDGKAVDKSEFHSSLYRADRTPKIFKSLVDAHNLGNWSPEGLSKVLGDASVEVYVSTSGNFPGGHGSIYDNVERKKVVMKAKEALERIQHVGNHQPVLASGERYYIYQYDSKPFAPLIDKIPNSPSHLVPDSDVFTNVWISSADSLTPAHYDKADNLLLQLQGRKSFLIWDPSQLSHLSLQSETSDQDRQTTINMRDQKSVEAHPNFRNHASAYHCVLNPGDVLYMPEGWIHAVYSIDTSASVNFWWNQPTVAVDMLMQVDNMIDFTLNMDAYIKFQDTKVAPIPIPFGVNLAKKFDTRENEQRFPFGEDEKKIPCQACKSNEHEYDKCPYLGHYRYMRISGQSCDYNMYELVEQQQPQQQPVFSLADFQDPFAATKTYRPVNKPLVPIPQGVTLADSFNNRANVMKGQSNVEHAHIDCQACGSKTHELPGCPYLGYYETIHVMGQACDYAGYRLRKLDQPAPVHLPAPAQQPLKMAIGLSLAGNDDGGFTAVNTLAQIIPPGLVLAKEFRSELGFMRQPKPNCQACNATDHGFEKCPYLGHYEYKRISGQVCDYELYRLK